MIQTIFNRPINRQASWECALKIWRDTAAYYAVQNDKEMQMQQHSTALRTKQ